MFIMFTHKHKTHKMMRFVSSASFKKHRIDKNQIDPFIYWPMLSKLPFSLYPFSEILGHASVIRQRLAARISEIVVLLKQLLTANGRLQKEGDPSRSAELSATHKLNPF